MSCYNWERGTIKIPSKEWKRVRDYIVGQANSRRTDTLNLALAIHKLLSDRALIAKAREAVKKVNKATPAKQRMKLANVTPVAIFDAVNDDDQYSPTVLQRALKTLTGFRGVKVYTHRDRWGNEDSDGDDTKRHTIELMLFPYIPDETGRVYFNTCKRKRLAKPRKGDDAVKHYTSTKVGNITLDEASISFDHKNKTLSWDVDENNRSVERAHQGWLWSALSTALGRVSWTRGTGGNLVGNDEYNRDDDGEGGGGNYVTHSFGPKVKRRAYSSY